MARLQEVAVAIVLVCLAAHRLHGHLKRLPVGILSPMKLALVTLSIGIYPGICWCLGDDTIPVIVAMNVMAAMDPIGKFFGRVHCVFELTANVVALALGVGITLTIMWPMYEGVALDPIMLTGIVGGLANVVYYGVEALTCAMQCCQARVKVT